MRKAGKTMRRRVTHGAERGRRSHYRHHGNGHDCGSPDEGGPSQPTQDAQESGGHRVTGAQQPPRSAERGDADQDSDHCTVRNVRAGPGGGLHWQFTNRAAAPQTYRASLIQRRRCRIGHIGRSTNRYSNSAAMTVERNAGITTPKKEGRTSNEFVRRSRPFSDLNSSINNT